MTLIEEVARSISGQDKAGWAALPENDRERLYGGGRWHDASHTRDDYRQDAEAVIAIVVERAAGKCSALHAATGNKNSGEAYGYRNAEIAIRALSEDKTR